MHAWEGVAAWLQLGLHAHSRQKLLYGGHACFMGTSSTPPAQNSHQNQCSAPGSLHLGIFLLGHKPTSTCHALSQELPDPKLPSEITDAFDVAFNNIKAFHQAQQQTQPLEVETMPGVKCKRVTRPIGGCSAWRALLWEVQMTPGVKRKRIH